MSYPRRRFAWLLLAAVLGAPATVLGDTATIAAGRLSLPGLDGVTRDMAHWRGRGVVLSFWATWCDPCIAEIPHLVALEERYRDRGISIVSVGIDEPGRLRNVARTLAINYPVLVADPENARPLLEAWGDKNGVIPYLVLIDRHGRVIAARRGPIDKEELDDFVGPLLTGDAGRR